MMTGLLAPVLVGFVALGTEAGFWMYKNRELQSAADSAALSAAVAVAAGNAPGRDDEARATAARYGFVDGAGGVTVSIRQPPTTGNYTGDATAVEVVVTERQKRLLTAIFLDSDVDLSGRAVARPSSQGAACVLALNRVASNALSSGGTSTVTLTGCSVAVNSNSLDALSTSGGGRISADSARVVGDVSGHGLETVNGVTTGAAPVPDPYANVAMPSASGCDRTNFSTNQTRTLDPGVYCGGMRLNAGADVTLRPGTYFIDGGDLFVNGGATLSGSGVTLVFTGSGSDYAGAVINGGATISLTAPTSGALAGIAFFGDRRMPVGTSFRLNGGATQNITGAIYLPRAEVVYSGGASTGSACTQLIGDTIDFNGNADFAADCAGVGTRTIALQQAVLVE